MRMERKKGTASSVSICVVRQFIFFLYFRNNTAFGVRAPVEHGSEPRRSGCRSLASTGSPEARKTIQSGGMNKTFRQLLLPLPLPNWEHDSTRYSAIVENENWTGAAHQYSAPELNLRTRRPQNALSRSISRSCTFYDAGMRTCYSLYSRDADGSLSVP